MRPFEEALTAELAGLLRASVSARAVRITVRDRLVTRFERGPLGAREVQDAVEAAVRAACRLAQELDAGDEVVEVVCWAALEAVRGHGGESARWLPDATRAVAALLEELAPERVREPAWGWLAARLSRW
jgi:hypothetical protein